MTADSVQATKRTYFVVTALQWLAVAIPLPVFVLFMQERGLSLAEIGVVMGAYALAIVLLELPTGGLADAVGRKRVAMLAHTIALLSGVAMFFAFSFAAFLVALILNGISRALSSGALDAWFIDRLREADEGIDLQAPLAQAGTVTLLALGAGTLLGGLLPTLFRGLADGPGSLLTPLSTTLLVSLLLKGALIVAIGGAVVESRALFTVNATWRSGLADVPRIVHEALLLNGQNHTLLALLAAALVGGFTLAGVETFWQPHFEGLLPGGATASWVFGLVMAASFVVGVAGNLLSIPLSRALGGQYAWVACLARAGQSAGLLLATHQRLLPAAAGFWVFYLNLGALNSPHDTLVNGEIPAERRSAMLSTQSLASYIGGFLGSVFLGYLAERASISLAWTLAGMLSMVSLLFYLAVARKQTRRKHDHEQEIPLYEPR